MEVGSVRRRGHRHRPGVEIFSCPGFVEDSAGLDWQAWAVGAGDFHRPLHCGISATLGATAAFLVGRYLARDAIARKIEKHEKFATIDRAVADEGWKIVLLTRLSPVFPFTLLNYAFGLTRVKLSHYVLASWLGMIPGTVMYVYLGSLVNVGAGHRQRTTGEWVLYGVGLLATVTVTVFVTRLAKKALAKKISSSGIDHNPAGL